MTGLTKTAADAHGSTVRYTGRALAAGALLFHALAAQAYIGPGAGLSAIGSILALGAAVVVAIFGFLWFPVKRLLRKRRAQQLVQEDTGDQPAEEPTQPSP
jgi:hypothetical protein